MRSKGLKKVWSKNSTPIQRCSCSTGWPTNIYFRHIVKWRRPNFMIWESFHLWISSKRLHPAFTVHSAPASVGGLPRLVWEGERVKLDFGHARATPLAVLLDGSRVLQTGRRHVANVQLAEKLSEVVKAHVELSVVVDLPLQRPLPPLRHKLPHFVTMEMIKVHSDKLLFYF